MHAPIILLSLAACLLRRTASFSPAAQRTRANAPSVAGRDRRRTPRASTAVLRMSDSGGGGGGGGGGGMEKAKDKKKSLSTIVIDKTDTEMEQEDIPEEMWRVILHNDEVHTFNYVIRSLQKVMGTLDKKKAFDICTVTHGQGQATVDSGLWKEQAMKYCLGMQRQGLTASIAPDNKFEGGGGGGDDGPEAG
eukprot:CAMPEP_0172544612 /NCGR_PEP_ID=MMETSP1067-20121228/14726_1 /TAXON_ID=265564 ORGANISM="Thalassiosira punctigera, Strain Tpunct2005C2" /NCGR_SAMPLE_ID=MMETSP1067 /ASSEMBLY_ACC=CAM_ASM_000444 /LENGTH=191 /DNA_ID=CAMNT_0013331207 /DNA_START=147 /DNA_END=722 /DNA_ORIENTATION=-